MMWVQRTRFLQQFSKSKIRAETLQTFLKIKCTKGWTSLLPVDMQRMVWIMILSMQFYVCVATLSSQIGLSALGFFLAVFAVFVVFVFVTTDYLLGTTITDHYAHWVDYSLFYFLLISGIPLSFKTGIFVKIQVLLIAHLASIMLVSVMHSVRISMKKKSRNLFLCQKFWTEKIKCYRGSQKKWLSECCWSPKFITKIECYGAKWPWLGSAWSCSVLERNDQQ